MSILQIRDKDGNFIPIHAIKGDDGKSAYEQAKEGGYNGTEAEFIALLNSLSILMINPTAMDDSEYSEHLTNYDNPHKVTAKQMGAVPEKYYASDNLNTEIQSGGGKITVCNYHSGTLNTPHKEGLTVFAHGMVITNACSTEYGTQLCMPSGDKHTFIRAFNKQGVTPWEQVADMSEVNELKARLEAAEAQKVNIATGVYVGTGNSGKSYPNTLTFSFAPKVVFLKGDSKASFFPLLRECNDFAYIETNTILHNAVTWNGNTVSWYLTEGNLAKYQANESGVTYHWVAIG